ncbi:MAG: anthranilate phosphoribosyltransferase [Acidiferrobacterales bacterium]
MSTNVESIQEIMRSIIGRIATGPELSKSISREEARIGMNAVLNGQVDPVQAAIFLIALRMKRETDDEFLGVLEAVLETTHAVTANVDDVVDIADPYDGYNRTLSSSPMLAPLLAAFGVPAFSQGVETVGPKYGITHRQVLREIGVPVDLSPEEAAARISNPEIGWAYIDQSKFNPRVHQLTELRTKIVKRPVLTTVEVLASPIRGKNKTHFVTGYVHKPYPRIYALLARHAGFDSALLVRGVEGGVVPSLRQTGKFVYYRNKGEERSIEIEPADLGIKQEIRSAALPKEFSQSGEGGDIVTSKVNAPAAAKVAAKLGLAALKGETGPIRDGLIYTGAMCLWHLGKFDTVIEAADAVREILDSGKVLERVPGQR